MKHFNTSLYNVIHRLNLDKTYTKGEGVWLTSSDEEIIMDCLAGYGSLPLGHSNKQICKHINHVISNKEPIMVQLSDSNAANELAKKLKRITHDQYKHICFTNSGTESNEAAIKAVRSASKKSKIVTFDNSFHGKTLGSLSATGQEGYKEGFFCDENNFISIPYDDEDELKRLLAEHSDTIAAVIVEPIQGEGGMIVPSGHYLRNVREITTKYNVFMIVDEVQTGLGRTGELFSHLKHGWVPDCITISKALGGGALPIGALLMNDDVANKSFQLKHSSTFAGNSLSCRVASKALDIISDPKFLTEINFKSQYLEDELLRVMSMKKADDRYTVSLSGKGLMRGMRIDYIDRLASPLLYAISSANLLGPILVSYLLNECNLRVATPLSGKNIIRIQPPLNITTLEIDFLVLQIEKLLGALKESDSVELLKPIFQNNRINKP